jgi:hypothetical protein
LLAYPYSLNTDNFRRLLTPTLNASKSANSSVRGASTALFRVLVEKKADDDGRYAAVADLLALAKGAKAAGPDRTVLYAMLSYFAPSERVSAAMVASVPGVLAKETSEAAIPLLASALAPHLAFHLCAGAPLPADVQATLVREMQSAKPATRRAFVHLVGDALWEIHTPADGPARALAQAALPALEASIKVIAANPLAATTGPLEGYVSVGTLLGPLSRVKELGAISPVLWWVPCSLRCFVVGRGNRFA